MFVRRFLQEVRDDFRRHLDQSEDLCHLRNLSFAGGAYPDYEAPGIAQLYLLRYFPAYLCEYYHIYSDLIDRVFLQGPMNVVSIGAGCGVDYYALEHVLTDNHLWPRGLGSYIAVDRVNWPYRIPVAHQGYRYIVADITELAFLPRQEINVIMFAKSLGELNEHRFRTLLGSIYQSEFTENRIVLMASIRSAYAAKDTFMLERLAEALRSAHGFACDEEPYTYRTAPVMQGFSAFSPDFYFPDDLKAELITLTANCRARGRDEACYGCDESLNRYPVLRTDYIAYQILPLYR